MKKQEYFDMGIASGLTPSQIEGVLCRVLDISKEKLFMLKEISSKYIYEVQQSFYSFEEGVPEEYALEKANFYGRDFFVDSRVLIPRNDTEVLVKQALQKINIISDVANSIYIDVGTGSGCIPVSIISEMYPLKFEKSFGLDISKDALDVAGENTDAFIKGEIELRESDLLSGVFHENIFEKKSIFITANLPYILDGDHENMDAWVVAHEPDTALYGGEKTGFELYEKLIKQCFQMKQIHKIASITLFIEIGFDQYEYSKEFLEDLWLSFVYFEDSANIKRVICVEGF